jgi:hypothetical protein
MFYCISIGFKYAFFDSIYAVIYRDWAPMMFAYGVK